jgi:pyoverdine/dityrosine biosynthesis protein Dit1
MAQQTAVSALMESIFGSDFRLTVSDDILNKYQISVEMDKQQHGQTWDAAIAAHDERGHVHARSLVDFDEYYNETYNTQAQ